MPNPELVKTAKTLISTRIFKSKHQKRALALVDSPSDLCQTEFGICGMAAIVYTLLEHQPHKFAQLAVEVLSNTGLVKELLTYYQSANPSETPELDFLVMTGIAYRLRGDRQGFSVTVFDKHGEPSSKFKRGDDVFSRSVQFSQTFDMGGGVMWDPLDPKGDLAATQTAVAAMLKSVLPDAYVCKIKHDTSMAQAIKDVNLYFDIYRSAFGFVAIKNAAEWMNVPKLGAQSSSNEQDWTFDVAPPSSGGGPPPKFEHWVWLSRGIERDTDYYVFHYWTWRQEYRLKIHTSVVDQFVYGFVAGHTDMSFA